MNIIYINYVIAFHCVRMTYMIYSCLPLEVFLDVSSDLVQLDSVAFLDYVSVYDLIITNYFI